MEEWPAEAEMKVEVVLPLIMALAVSSPLTVGCAKSPITYHNGELGYTVLMPQGWQVVNEPVSLITGQKYSKNTIGFRNEFSLNAGWVYVEVSKGENAFVAVGDIRLSPHSEEYKVQEYGKSGYELISKAVEIR